MIMKEPELQTAREYAERHGCDVASVRKWKQRGKIAPVGERLFESGARAGHRAQLYRTVDLDRARTTRMAYGTSPGAVVLRSPRPFADCPPDCPRRRH